MPVRGGLDVAELQRVEAAGWSDRQPTWRPASVVRSTVPSVPPTQATVEETADSPRNCAVLPVGGQLPGERHGGLAPLGLRGPVGHRHRSGARHEQPGDRGDAEGRRRRGAAIENMLRT